MGQEFGQGAEWNYQQGLDWHLLEVGWHQGVQLLVKDLNRAYRELPALHQRDCDGAGFTWVDANNAEQSVFAWLRHGEPGTPSVLVVVNFTPVPREGYRIGLPACGRWVERINTDAALYGGSGMGNLGGVEAVAEPWHGHPCSATLTIPPLAALFFVADG
jgi:1,4-alpha-glucan branching enzyme